MSLEGARTLLVGREVALPNRTAGRLELLRGTEVKSERRDFLGWVECVTPEIKQRNLFDWLRLARQEPEQQCTDSGSAKHNFSAGSVSPSPSPNSWDVRDRVEDVGILD